MVKPSRSAFASLCVFAALRETGAHRVTGLGSRRAAKTQRLAKKIRPIGRRNEPRLIRNPKSEIRNPRTDLPPQTRECQRYKRVPPDQHLGDDKIRHPPEPRDRSVYIHRRKLDAIRYPPLPCSKRQRRERQGVTSDHEIPVSRKISVLRL